MDNLTPEQRRRNMRNIKSKDTRAEVILRKTLWHKGYRYRKNWKELPGKPDIAITKYRIAIFCDGEFFHGKDYHIKKKPETNAEYWERKILYNIKRDQKVDADLKGLGWHVIRFWSRDIINNLSSCVESIEEIIYDIEINEIFTASHF